MFMDVDIYAFMLVHVVIIYLSADCG